jgi:ribosomal protein S18 acetylase RimI-like enzyme
MQLRRVEEGESALWARVTVASLQKVRQTEAEIAEAFAGQSEKGKREAYLAWDGERAVGRLRLRVSGERCDVWAAGLLPEAGEDAVSRLLAAIEATARAADARRMVLELRPGQWEGTALLVEACYAAGYYLLKQRTRMVAVPVRRPVACDRPMRHPRPEDEGEFERLARLFYEGYRGAIDYEGETLEDAREAAQRFLNNRHWDLLVDSSFVVEGDAEPAALALMSREGDGTVWLMEVVVHPRYRGRGYSRTLIQAAMNACAEKGIAEMHLMVTLGNVPAEGLYRRMGFADVPDTVQYNLEKEIV